MSKEASMGAMSQIERQPLRVAAIYARVSSERQREGGTIESQVAGLHELAQARGLVVPEQLVFLDEGFSGAMLLRPALERLRDRAAEGCFEVLLCHCPDRLARRYAYQVLLLEELDRAGVEVVFLREGERSGSPEDELLRQFQGMIAEYERAQIWDRATVWGMLRNPAYRGQAAFGKTQTSGQRAKPTRPARARGERHGRRETRRDQPPENWTLVPVPALISEQTFELAQARLQENKRFAARNTKQPTLLQGILVCRECGYACYRTSTRTSSRRIYYYRCIGSDNYRHVGGRVCQSRPIRADELDDLVWAEVRHLLEQPELVRAEIKRRLEAVRSQHPAARRREGLERELARVRAGTARLIEAYQEQLIALEELRERMPKLRKRETTLTAQLSALEAELHDAETYLKLAETLEGFLARLADGLDQLTVHEQQRVLRLVVREVLIGGEQDNVTIRHSIPTPSGDGSPSCQLRGSSPRRTLRRPVLACRPRSALDHSCPEPFQDQAQDSLIRDSVLEELHQPHVIEAGEEVAEIRVEHPVHLLAFDPDHERVQRIVRAAPRPEAVREAEEVRLVDGVQHLDDGALDDLVLQRGNPERPQPPVRLRDVHPPRRLRPVSAPVDTGMQIPKVLFEILPVVLPRHLVHPRRRRRAQPPIGRAQALDADVVQKRREPRIPVLPRDSAHTIQRT